MTDLDFVIPDIKLHKVPELELYTKCRRPKPLDAVTLKIKYFRSYTFATSLNVVWKTSGNHHVFPSTIQSSWTLKFLLHLWSKSPSARPSCTESIKFHHVISAVYGRWGSTSIFKCTEALLWRNTWSLATHILRCFIYHDLIYHNLLEKLCCIDKLATHTDAAIALFLFHHSWYDILADTMLLHFFTEDDMAINQQKILHVTQGFKRTSTCTFHTSIIICVKFNAEDFNVMFFSNYEFCKNQYSANHPLLIVRN